MVQELLGEGTFAKVFKATLKQEKPPAPVSVIFHIVVIVIMRIGKRPHISPKPLKIDQILLLYITMICFIFVVK